MWVKLFFDAVGPQKRNNQPPAVEYFSEYSEKIPKFVRNT